MQTLCGDFDGGFSDTDEPDDQDHHHKRQQATGRLTLEHSFPSDDFPLFPGTSPQNNVPTPQPQIDPDVTPRPIPATASMMQIEPAQHPGTPAITTIQHIGLRFPNGAAIHNPEDSPYLAHEDVNSEDEPNSPLAFWPPF